MRTEGRRQGREKENQRTKIKKYRITNKKCRKAEEDIMWGEESRCRKRNDERREGRNWYRKKNKAEENT